MRIFVEKAEAASCIVCEATQNFAERLDIFYHGGIHLIHVVSVAHLAVEAVHSALMDEPRTEHDGNFMVYEVPGQHIRRRALICSSVRGTLAYGAYCGTADGNVTRGILAVRGPSVFCCVCNKGHTQGHHGPLTKPVSL